MNRNGIGTLVRAGSGPARGGIGSLNRAHVARGEMVLPREAMAKSPGLRYHAAQSMSRMGRDPAQYTVGSGRNSRNPRTGAMEYADMFYDPAGGGWMSATGTPVDFSQSYDSYANTGTTQESSPLYDASTGMYRSPSIGGFTPTNATPRPYEDLSPQMQAVLSDWNNFQAGKDAMQIVNERGNYDSGGYQLNAPLPAPTESLYATTTESPFGSQPIPMPISTQNGTPMEPVNTGLPATQQGMAGSGGSYPDFSAWTSPQTYDQWRETRNPAGKNAPNVLFGQAAPGAEQTPFGGQTVMGDASGQMPVGNPVPWSIPGTSLGFATDGGNSTPSMLNNGYQPYQGFNPFDGLFGGNQNGGITFGAPSFGQQQQQQTPNYAALFKSY